MFTSQPLTDRSVMERDFVLDVDGRKVPGVLWTPPTTKRSSALVLFGHGARGDRREARMAALAQRLAQDAGLFCAAIDGPDHGDRLSGETPDHRSTDRTDSMIADWKATADWLTLQLPVASVGYWGLSMGTVYGVPLVAADPRVQAAVFGLNGLLPGPANEPYRERNRRRFLADAPTISIPVLFLAQWDDELWPLESALALFGLLGSKQKTMRINPGAHGAVPGSEFDASGEFLQRFLTSNQAT